MAESFQKVPKKSIIEQSEASRGTKGAKVIMWVLTFCTGIQIAAEIPALKPDIISNLSYGLPVILNLPLTIPAIIASRELKGRLRNKVLGFIGGSLLIANVVAPFAVGYLNGMSINTRCMNNTEDTMRAACKNIELEEISTKFEVNKTFWVKPWTFAYMNGAKIALMQD